MPQRQAGDVGQVHAARQAEVVPAGDLRGDARRHQGSDGRRGGAAVRVPVRAGGRRRRLGREVGTDFALPLGRI